MYRGPSPPFDVPEFPTLRRVKPLPKRRRTSDSFSSPPPSLSQFPFPENLTLANLNLNLGAVGLGSFLEGLQLPGPEATAEELLAHAETLSARMALQSYYLGADAEGKVQGQLGNINTEGGAERSPAINYSTGYAVGGMGMRRPDEHDDEHGDGDGDYIDHLQQPNNTKKRKVPTNASLARAPHSPSSSPSPEHKEHEVAEVYHPPPSSASFNSFATRRVGKGESKLGKATIAGMRHKEMLKTRKRQLAAVLGALSVGDTLALDQALSASYPIGVGGMRAGSGVDGGGTGTGREWKVRLSKRRVVRLARTAKRLPRHPDQAPFPTAGFTFVCPSATADRLIATKEEVTALRARFEAELARQASKAAKMAAAARGGSGGGGGGRRKRAIAGSGGMANKGSVGGGISGNGNGNLNIGEGEDAAAQGQGGGTKAKAGGKKKKRSALANASNPHHLRNYVPSRLPHSNAAAAAALEQQNYVSPLPLRFLSADIPPRRQRKASANNVNATQNLNQTQTQIQNQLTNPADEWICAFCEYALFYGEDYVGGGGGGAEYRKAVRNRKKILRRRRRARERAARAARGIMPAGKSGGGDEEAEWEGGMGMGGLGVGGAGEERRVGVGVGVDLGGGSSRGAG